MGHILGTKLTLLVKSQSYVRILGIKSYSRGVLGDLGFIISNCKKDLFFFIFINKNKTKTLSDFVKKRGK